MIIGETNYDNIIHKKLTMILLLNFDSTITQKF
jgi:hypothetical protein